MVKIRILFGFFKIVLVMLALPLINTRYIAVNYDDDNIYIFTNENKCKVFLRSSPESAPGEYQTSFNIREGVTPKVIKKSDLNFYGAFVGYDFAISPSPYLSSIPGSPNSAQLGGNGISYYYADLNINNDICVYNKIAGGSYDGIYCYNISQPYDNGYTTPVKLLTQYLFLDSYSIISSCLLPKNTIFVGLAEVQLKIKLFFIKSSSCFPINPDYFDIELATYYNAKVYSLNKENDFLFVKFKDADTKASKFVEIKKHSVSDSGGTGYTFSDGFSIKIDDAHTDVLDIVVMSDEDFIVAYAVDNEGIIFERYSSFTGKLIGRFTSKQKCNFFRRLQIIKTSETEVAVGTSCTESESSPTEIYEAHVHKYYSCEDIDLSYFKGTLTININEGRYKVSNEEVKYINFDRVNISNALVISIGSSSSSTFTNVAFGDAYEISSKNTVKFVPSGTPNNFKVYYSIANNPNKEKSSGLCYFELKKGDCYENCNGCTKVYDNTDNQYCIDCNESRFPLSDDSTKCYSQTDGYTDKTKGYYFSSTDEKYMKCLKTCKACQNGIECTECADGYEISNDLSIITAMQTNCVCSSKIWYQDGDDTHCLDSIEKCKEIYLYPLENANGYTECVKSCDAAPYIYVYDHACTEQSCSQQNKFSNEDEGTTHILCLDSCDHQNYPFYKDFTCHKNCPDPYNFYEDEPPMKRCVETCSTFHADKNTKICCTDLSNKDCINECYFINEFYEVENDRCVSKCADNYIENYADYKCHSQKNLEDLYEEFKDKDTVEKAQAGISLNLEQIYTKHTVLNTSKFIISVSDSTDIPNEVTATINLKECLNIIKTTYKTTNIYIGIVENKSSDSLYYITDYEIYLQNHTKVDKSLCKNVDIDINSPIRNYSLIDLENVKYFFDKDINVTDPKDDFFNDLCYPFTNRDGLDVTLGDRRTYYFQNVSLCPSECEYVKVNLTKHNIQCNCKFPQQKEEEKSNTKYYDDFKTSIKNSNFGIVKCYHLVFSSDFFSNIGSLLMLAIALIQLVSFILYKYKGFETFKQIIEEAFAHVSSPPKHKKGAIHLTEANTKNTPHKIRINHVEFIDTSKSKKGRSLISVESLENQNPNSITLYSKNSCKPLEELGVRNRTNKISLSKFATGTTERSLQKKGYSIEVKAHAHHGHRNNNYVNSDDSLQTENGNNKKKLLKSQQSEKKEHNIMQNDKPEIDPYIRFNKYELNYMSYEEALEYDKRSFCLTYRDIILVTNNIIYTFFGDDKLVLKAISISLFLFHMSLTLTVNCLFYDNDHVSNNFDMKGQFDFVYNFPIVVYSFVISFLIGIVVDFLTSMKNRLLYIKIYYKDEESWSEEKIIKCAKIKLGIYFAIICVLTVLFWYYIACFCAVFRNNQVNWIIDASVSVALDFVMAFFIAFIIALFRYFGVTRECSCLFSISDLLI